jgi:hypothetical protein
MKLTILLLICFYLILAATGGMEKWPAMREVQWLMFPKSVRAPLLNLPNLNLFIMNLQAFVSSINKYTERGLER